MSVGRSTFQALMGRRPSQGEMLHGVCADQGAFNDVQARSCFKYAIIDRKSRERLRLCRSLAHAVRANGRFRGRIVCRPLREAV